MFKNAKITEFLKITDSIGTVQELNFSAVIELKDSQEIKKMEIKLSGDQLAKEIAENGANQSGILAIITKYVRENYIIWAKEMGIKQEPVKATTSTDIIKELGTDTIESI